MPQHARPLFHLGPSNVRAKAVIAHPFNAAFVSVLQNGTRVLDIGRVRSKSADSSVLATLSRGDADIYVEGSTISKIQCSFELNSKTGVIMLYDRSHGRTTEVFGEHAVRFENARPRKLVVQKKLNTIVGMGGERRNLVQFELYWPCEPVSAMQEAKDRGSARSAYEDNPRFARTVDEAETVLPSTRETRFHTPAPHQLMMRYVKLGPSLGAGAFGTVSKAIDVDSGNLMAVKILTKPEGPIDQEEQWRRNMKYAVEREIKVISQIHHVSRASSLSSVRIDKN